MFRHLDQSLTDEIRETTKGLPLYSGDPRGIAIDYTEAQEAYAANITLLRGHFIRHPTGLHLPTPETEALLVRRAMGDGKVGSLSGISGYIDTLHDPDGLLTDAAFDPIAYTARAEPHEECGIPWEEMHAIEMHLGAIVHNGINLTFGRRFQEPRYAQHGLVHVLPLVGVCYGEPTIRLNRDELSEAVWAPLGEIAQAPDLSPGYLENTLPNALGSLGLRVTAIRDILGINHNTLAS